MSAGPLRFTPKDKTVPIPEKPMHSALIGMGCDDGLPSLAVRFIRYGAQGRHCFLYVQPKRGRPQSATCHIKGSGSNIGLDGLNQLAGKVGFTFPIEMAGNAERLIRAMTMAMGYDAADAARV